MKIQRKKKVIKIQEVNITSRKSRFACRATRRGRALHRFFFLLVFLVHVALRWSMPKLGARSSFISRPGSRHRRVRFAPAGTHAPIPATGAPPAIDHALGIAIISSGTRAGERSWFRFFEDTKTLTRHDQWLIIRCPLLAIFSSCSTAETKKKKINNLFVPLNLKISPEYNQTQTVLCRLRVIIIMTLMMMNGSRCRLSWWNQAVIWKILKNTKKPSWYSIA